MARAASRHTQAEWQQIGRDALLDLVADRLVVPWAEAEARISITGWKNFERVQPVQLSGARQSLEEDGLIVVEHTGHTPSVTTIRIPYPPGRQREIERLRGQRRKGYRIYLSWAQDGRLCGKHAEQAVLESAQAAASGAGLWVPPQRIGRIDAVRETTLSQGPLDVLAYVLGLPEPASDAALLFEVKNIHSWVYPWTSELWELLAKAAELALKTPVMPVLVCVRAAYPTNQMAKDVGFFGCYLGSQVFNPSIPTAEFDAIAAEFGLAIRQHDGPLEPVTSFLTKTLRYSPPASPPYDEDIPWYRRQRDRFRHLAPIVLKHQALAGEGLTGPARRAILNSFRAEMAEAVTWPLVRGW